MPAETLRVTGYTTFLRACDRAGRDTKVETRAAFRESGDAVRKEWSLRFASIDPRSAAGYRVSVRQTGVFVVQSIRKTTGLRPDYGALQERFGLRVLTDLEPVIERAAEHALDRVADNFDS